MKVYIITDLNTGQPLFESIHWPEIVEFLRTLESVNIKIVESIL